ncbi:carbohydrate kinase family protein [bacterium]|nr:carbohydrate kinase family protein [bacterium]
MLTPSRLAIIGDVFADLSATGLSSLPQWGCDVAVERPINMLAGGSGFNSAVQLASMQRDPRRGIVTGPASAGVDVMLYAALGDDSFANFLQNAAYEMGVNMQRVRTGPASGEGEDEIAEATGTGVCMVLAGYTDSSRTRIDRSFVTHYGVVAEMRASDLDWQALRDGADHVHISGYYNFKGLHGAEGEAQTARMLQYVRAAGVTTSVCAQFDSSQRWEGNAIPTAMLCVRY